MHGSMHRCTPPPRLALGLRPALSLSPSLALSGPRSAPRPKARCSIRRVSDVNQHAMEQGLDAGRRAVAHGSKVGAARTPCGGRTRAAAGLRWEGGAATS